MRVLLPIAVCFSILLGAFFVSGSAHAQLSIAVVDVDRVLGEAQAAQTLQKKRETAREKFLSSLREKEQTLRKEAEDILAKRQEMDEDAFATAEQEYQNKIQELGRLTQKQRREFEKASSQSLIALRDQLSSAVQGIAKEEGYQLVISNRDVIAGETSLDITEKVLKKMNADAIEIPFVFKVSEK